MLDLKKLFPNSKFPTAEELKAKEDTFSIGDRVKVSDNIRCIQHGQIGTIVQIEPEDKYGWKSFVVRFDDEKYGAMGFNSGSIDKILESGADVKNINENTKVTLTFGQLKKLVKEAVSDESVKINWDNVRRMPEYKQKIIYFAEKLRKSYKKKNVIDAYFSKREDVVIKVDTWDVSLPEEYVDFYYYIDCIRASEDGQTVKWMPKNGSDPNIVEAIEGQMGKFPFVTDGTPEELTGLRFVLDFKEV